MTIDEKRNMLQEMCNGNHCGGCPLENEDVCEGNFMNMALYEVERLFDIAFTPKPYIKDSGERREFETGAVRDIQEGKGRCDLLPLDIVYMIYRAKTPRCAEAIRHISKFVQTGVSDHLIEALENFMLDDKPWDANWATMWLEVSKHFEEGAKKYGEYNWQKGCLIIFSIVCTLVVRVSLNFI